MRPVTKKSVGESINLEEGSLHTVQEDYKPYQDARPVLLANLGHYCSYCEEVFHCVTNLQIDHVQHKGVDKSGVKPYADLSTKWDNFLLGCAIQNITKARACKSTGLFHKRRVYPNRIIC